MLRVAIIGGSGYTGAELLTLLCHHPEVTVTVVTSRQYAGQPVNQIYPGFGAACQLVYENPDPVTLAGKADFFFTAVPHKTGMNIVPALLDMGKKVVDLSADFRLRNAQVYETWYQPHCCPERLSEAVYGLPELYRERIINSRLVANPGCYPTSVILALAPLLREHLVDPGSIIIDAKSGVSGAGRVAQTGTLYCEVAENFSAYKVGGQHRHIPEIEQELSLLAGESVIVSFTPHLLPASRGMLSTIYCSENETPFNEEELTDLYATIYADDPFVRILPVGRLPMTRQVCGSNYCDIGFKVDQRTGRLIVVSAIDNVCKGASGQAIQNMNLMMGFGEAQGLNWLPRVV